MDQKNRVRIAILISLLVVSAVVLSFGFSLLAAGRAHIDLPAPAASVSTPVGPSDPGDILPLEVTVDTVQTVIAALDRSDSYYRQLTAQSFWEGGSASTSVETWVDGGFTYVRSTMPSGQVRHTLSDGEAVYYWYSGSSTWFTAPAGTLSPDLSQHIPTYEDVLALEPEAISAAGFESYGEQPCIYVETRVDDLGYLERYWISTGTGLLVGAETVKGDRTVYSVSGVSPVQTPCPTDVVFALPNGNVLHSF